MQAKRSSRASANCSEVPPSLEGSNEHRQSYLTKADNEYFLWAIMSSVGFLKFPRMPSYSSFECSCCMVYLNSYMPRLMTLGWALQSIPKSEHCSRIADSVIVCPMQHYYEFLHRYGFATSCTHFQRDSSAIETTIAYAHLFQDHFSAMSG